MSDSGHKWAELRRSPTITPSATGRRPTATAATPTTSASPSRAESRAGASCGMRPRATACRFATTASCRPRPRREGPRVDDVALPARTVRSVLRRLGSELQRPRPRPRVAPRARRLSGARRRAAARIHLAPQRPHLRQQTRQANSRRVRCDQRLRRRPDRGRDLALADLALVGRVRDRGRRPGRRRSRQRPAHDVLPRLAVRARRRAARALLDGRRPAHDRADPRDAPALDATTRWRCRSTPPSPAFRT